LSVALEIHDIDDFISRLEKPTKELIEGVNEALSSGELEAWLEVRYEPQEDAQKLIGKLREMQKSVGARGRLACFALRELLNPGGPLPLKEGLSLWRPQDIGSVLEVEPRERRLRLEALQERCEDGHVEEWLRACGDPHAERVPALLRDCVGRYPSEPLLQAHVFCWSFVPGSGIPFMGKEVNAPQALAALIDGSAAARRDGLLLLQSGWLRQWLLASGRLVDAQAFDRVLEDGRLPAEGKLEAVLHLLDPSLPWPGRGWSASPRIWNLAKCGPVPAQNVS
jgi:hypothetical protein